MNTRIQLLFSLFHAHLIIITAVKAKSVNSFGIISVSLLGD